MVHVKSSFDIFIILLSFLDVLIGGYEIELVERNDKEDSFPLVSRTVALDSVVFMRLRPQLQQADKSSISACWCPDQQSPLLLPSHHSADAKCTYILLEAVTKKIGRHSIVLVHEDEGGIESEVVTLEVIPKSKDTMALLIGATYEGNAPLHGTLHDVQRMEILLRHEFGFDSIEKLTAKEVTKDNITRKLLEIQKKYESFFFSIFISCNQKSAANVFAYYSIVL